MPSTFPYREVLPYRTESSAQSLEHLNRIVESVYVAVAAGDARGVFGGSAGAGPALTSCTRELKLWLRLKHPMPLPTRINLTRCYYELCLSAVDAAAAERYAEIVALLWKSRRLAMHVTYKDVQLDASKLLRAYKKSILVHTSPYDGSQPSMTSSLSKLARSIAWLLDPSFAEQLLSESLSLLSTTPSGGPLMVLNMIALMYPHLVSAKTAKGAGEESLAQTGSTAFHQDVLPTLFHVWRLLPAGSAYDAKAIEVISSVVEACVDVPATQWGPYGVLTADQLSAVLAGVLRLLDIPMNSRQARQSDPRTLARVTRPAAILIVSSLGSDCSGSSALALLHGLIHTVESFTHPSSTGPWSAHILQLVHDMVEVFVLRWNMEQMGESMAPRERELTAETKRKFVEIMLPVVFYGIHSKLKVLSTLTLLTLHGIAYLEPDLVIPKVLEEAYPSIQGLYETHRTITSLGALSHVMRIMARHPKYAMHITTLLELALPCIESSDLAKTIYALAFVQTAAFSVPFVDLSANVGGPERALECLPLAVDALAETGELPAIDDALAAEVVQASSFAFNEIVTALLARIFALLESIVDHTPKFKNSPEYLVSHNLPTTVAAVLYTCSPELYDKLLNQLLEFVTEQVIQPATETVAHICGIFVQVRPERAYKRLFPLLNTSIRYEITENNAGSTRSTAPRDHTLIWYMSILNMTLAAAGAEILTHAQDLLDLTVFLRENTRGQIVYHISNTVHHAIASLVGTYTHDFSFLPPGEQAKLDHWGYQPDVKDLRLRWHVPSVNEVDFALQLYKAHINRSITAITEVIASSRPSGADTDLSDTLATNLTYIRTATSAVSLLLDPNFDYGEPRERSTSPESEDEIDFGDLRGVDIVSTNYFFADMTAEKQPLYQAVHAMRQQVGETLLKVDDFLQLNDGDVTTPFKELLFALKVWFSDVGIERSSKSEHHHRMVYEYESRYFTVLGLRKQLPRGILAHRAALYHQERLGHCGVLRPATRLETELLSRLVHAAFSIYSDSRRHAEVALYAALKAIKKSRPRVYNEILETIDKHLAAQEWKQAEAGFRLLGYRSMGAMIKRNGGQIGRWMGTVLQAISVDNQSLVDQAFKTFSDCAGDAFRLPVLPPTDDGPAATALQVVLSPELESQIERLRSQRATRRADAADQLAGIAKILGQFSLIDQHWRVSLVSAITLFSLVASPQTPGSGDSIVSLVSGTMSSHPEIKRVSLYGLMCAGHKNYTKAVTHGDYSVYELDGPRLQCETQVEVPVTDITTADVIAGLTNGTWNKFDLDVYFDSGPMNPAYPGQEPPVYGWLVWPQSHFPAQTPARGLPMPSGDDQEGERHDEKQLEIVGKYLVDSDFARAFFKRQAVEPRAEDDHFDALAAACWRQYLTLASDPKCPLQFEHVLAFVDGLAPPAEADRNWHRAAAELTVGMLHAQPLLSPTHAQQSVATLARLLQRALAELAHDNLSYWQSFARWGFLGADLRRVAPIIEILAATTVTAQSGLRDSFRLYLHSEVIAAQGWRYRRGVPALLENLWANVAHPASAVRSEVARQLAVVVASRFHESVRDLPTLLQANAAAGPLGSRAYVLDEGSVAALRAQIQKVEELRVVALGEPLSTDSPFSVHARAVVGLLSRMLAEPAASALLPLLPDLIFPLLLSLSNIREDSDLLLRVNGVFQQLSALPHPQDCFPAIIAMIGSSLSAASWHQKLRVLLYVQSFFFSHMFSMTPAQRREVVEAVVQALDDVQVEVRELAAETLSGIVRCLPPQEQRDLTNALTKQFTLTLNQTQPARPARDSRQSRQSTPLGRAETPGRSPEVVRRHATVLGLGALVNAFPYQSPPPLWVPSVLATLAVKASGEGGIVGKSVKSILSDFKKTRQDSWHIDQKVFTQDQLDDLEGVLWKNYFV